MRYFLDFFLFINVKFIHLCIAKRDENLARLTNTREDMLLERQRKAVEHKQRTLAMYDNMAKSAPAGGKKKMDIGILHTGQSMLCRIIIMLYKLFIIYICQSLHHRHQVAVTTKCKMCYRSANRLLKFARRKSWLLTKLRPDLPLLALPNRLTWNSSLKQMVCKVNFCLAFIHWPFVCSIQLSTSHKGR